MAVWTKYFMMLARTLTSFELRIWSATHPAMRFAVRITQRTLGAALGPSSLAQALLRHSIALIRWKWSDSIMVNWRASSTGEMSKRRILRPPGTRGRSGAGGESRPPETIRRGASVSAERYRLSADVKVRRGKEMTYPTSDKSVNLLGHRLRPFVLQILGEFLYSIENRRILHFKVVHVEPGPDGVDHPDESVHLHGDKGVGRTSI